MSEYEEEEEFTEVSYYEEEVITESEDDGPAIEEYRAPVQVPPAPQRPVHPLVAAGAGGKAPPANTQQRPVNPMVAALAGGAPPPAQRPVNPMVAALAGGAPPPAQRPVHPMVAAASGAAPPPAQRPVHPMVAAASGGAPPPAQRPVHPMVAAASGGAPPPAQRPVNPMVAALAGGAPPPAQRPVNPMMAASGGGGGGAKSSLNDQIAAMAAKRNKRVAEEGTTVPEPAPKPKKSTGGGSMADQVAEMAAKRRERMGQAQTEAPVANKAPVQAAATVETKVALKKTPAPPPKQAAPAPKPAAAQVERKSVAPEQTIPKAAPAQKPAFLQAILRKTPNSDLYQEPAPEPTPEQVPAPPVKANPISKKTSTTTERTRDPGTQVFKITTTVAVTTTDLVTMKSSVETTVTETTEGANVPPVVKKSTDSGPFVIKKSSETTETENVDPDPEGAPVVTNSNNVKVINRETDECKYHTVYCCCSHAHLPFDQMTRVIGLNRFWFLFSRKLALFRSFPFISTDTTDYNVGCVCTIC
jgi:hypothetical protein